MSDLSIDINPEYLDTFESEFLEMEAIYQLAIAGANGDPEFDQLLANQKLRNDAMREILETMKLNAALTNKATFKL